MVSPVARNAGRSTAFEAPSIGPAPVATNVTRSCHADVIDLHLKGRTIVMKDRPMRAVLIAALLLVLAMPAHVPTDTDSQVWTTVEAYTALDAGVKLTIEAIGRFGDDADGLYELEIGARLGIQAEGGVR